MIALDTSAMIRFLDGRGGALTPRIEALIATRSAVLPTVVVTEFLSSPKLSIFELQTLRLLPVLETIEGFWRRTGELRSAVAQHGRRAKLGDALIAQSCIDADVPLLTADADFRVFADLGGLRLA